MVFQAKSGVSSAALKESGGKWLPSAHHPLRSSRLYRSSHSAKCGEGEASVKVLEAAPASFKSEVPKHFGSLVPRNWSRNEKRGKMTDRQKICRHSRTGTDTHPRHSFAHISTLKDQLLFCEGRLHLLQVFYVSFLVFFPNIGIHNIQYYCRRDISFHPSPI